MKSKFKRNLIFITLGMPIMKNNYIVYFIIKYCTNNAGYAEKINWRQNKYNQKAHI